MIGNPFVKHHPTIFHALKSILPGAITIMHLGRWGFKQVRVVYQEFFRKHGFPTSLGPHHQNTGRGMKTKRLTHLHDGSEPIKKRHVFKESVGLEPTHGRDLCPPRLYRLSYDSFLSRVRTFFPLLIGHTQTGFFSTCFILTTTLMIRVTTDLIPSRLLAYNQLLKALSGLMVIAYIIMIGKVI